MAVKKRIGCTKKSDCEAMANRITEGGAGFEHVTLFNISTSKARYIGIRYRKNRKDRGIMLNFCPWCGGNLQFFESAK